MTEDRATKFVEKINAMSMGALVNQYFAIGEDYPNYAEDRASLAAAGQMMHLIDTLGELKFGWEWKRALDGDR